jgi:mono/diheme cytochrome c family protein
MRKALRIARRVLAGVLALVLVAVGALYAWSTWRLRQHHEVRVTPVSIPTDAAAIERGRHLATSVALCTQCHGADLGGKMFFDGGAMTARLAAPNLTWGRGGVAAAYTDTDWLRAVRHGVAPDGRALLVMPSADFARFSAEDIGAILAFVKSRPSVDREWPRPAVGPIGRALLAMDTKHILPVLSIDHAAPPPVMPTSDDVLARGQHLVSVAGCRGCHTPELTGGAGPPPGAANITPVGLGGWTERDFMHALRTGVAPGGRQLAPSLPRAYGAMTDEELRAIWAFLRTVPAKGEKTPRQLAMQQAAGALRTAAATAP